MNGAPGKDGNNGKEKGKASKPAEMPDFLWETR